MIASGWLPVQELDKTVDHSLSAFIQVSLSAPAIVVN
jgi:hypothetical protein